MVMATKLVLRPYTLSFTILSSNRFFPSKPSLPKPPTLSLFSTTNSSQTQTQTQTQTLDQTFSYGPSLQKGTKQHQSQSPLKIFNQYEEHNEAAAEEYVIDYDSFTRVFDIAAIRVPSKDCFALETRLRGHLLNWPRIRNVARVPGDDMDEEFTKLLSEKRDDEENLDSLNRRIYGKAEGDGDVLSPVLYREKLVKTFDSRGFAKFKNLAKLSRPKKKKKKRKEEEEESEGKKWHRKSDFVSVEVVEEREEEEEDLSGLLGDEFKGKKWRGSTRLLLLDERYADKSIEEMPEAIKVAVSSP